MARGSHGALSILNGVFLLMSKVLLFPGQGSQFVGMGKDLFGKLDLAKQYYSIANEILETDIAGISFEGPAEELKKTQNTQPAIFIHSVIVFQYLKEKGLQFSGVAGHSLGEFSALVAADVLSFEDALKLVKVRSSEMAKAGSVRPGTMAAIIGASDEQLDKICLQDGIVVKANVNAPGQVVISGETDAVAKAIETAKEIGVRRALPLNVSGAFHSPLMTPARKPLSEIIESLHFSDAKVPVYQNATAEAVTDKDDIRKNILSQLESPVLWVNIILNMKRDGFSSFLELGPGKVLQGLNRRIYPDATILSLGSVDQLEQYEV